MTLPEIKSITALPVPFPTRWQAVIFRNYGIIPVERLAKVLGTTENTVRAEAKRLGLEQIEYNPDWLVRGYATIVRNNWHLLDYEGLQTLLGVTADELAFSLKEDDFLGVKLGSFKPDVCAPKYAPLTQEQRKETERIGAFVREKYQTPTVKPFDFYTNAAPIYALNTQEGGERIVYSYAAPYGDFLLTGDFSGYPDEMLARLQQTGVNGIWMQGMLSQLSPHPYASEQCKEYALRRKNLKKLIAKLGAYGIKLYLYLNEPRSLPTERLPVYLRGHTQGAFTAMCSSQEETWDYLYGAIRSLVREVPEIGGFITITMSENLTHCKSKNACTCARCAEKQGEIFAAKVNNTILRATREAGSSASVIANLWGWNASMGWSEEQMKNGIDALDKDVAIMAVSETLLDIKKGGVQNRVIDYSISNGKESALTKRVFRHAKKRGHRILAKVQVNNSWECSAVPYFPAFDLVAKHLTQLKKDGVSGYMLSWTLGGYPSVACSLASAINSEENFDLDEWYAREYGAQANEVHSAVRKLCAAFQQFPFDVTFLYRGTLQTGASNPWYLQNTGLTSTMVGYPYDDIQTWRGAYPMDVFLSQLGLLSSQYNAGLKRLERLEKTPAVKELCLMAKVCAIHFESTYLQVKFNLEKQTADATTLLSYIRRERELCESLQTLALSDARVGFEASNHYYYTQNTLLEKMLNLNELEKTLIGTVR